MRRNNRRYARGYRRNQTNFSILIIIIIFAVVTGYAGTKYIIYPYFLNGQKVESDNEVTKESDNTTDSGINTITSLPSVIIDKQEVKDLDKSNDDSNEKTTDDKATASKDSTEKDKESTETSNKENDTKDNTSSDGAYSLQFGNFESKEGASNRVKELTSQGINAYVFESGGSYRVLGNTYDSKDKAKEAANIVSNSAIDVFIIDMKTII
ncbi:SPOR domain-containing protein [Anaerovorax odorimutans]|uniref:SPOR domain-containing protein n=1 Tax=Anaerovorax odorimutans TaxID=109327 RepID=UPI0003FC330D|nr:SPOR domain-containing protein [Anaerovorax odorimutans]